MKKLCDLGINILNGFGFALVCLQNFKKLLVNFWGACEAILDWSAQNILERRQRLTFILFT